MSADTGTSTKPKSKIQKICFARKCCQQYDIGADLFTFFLRMCVCGIYSANRRMTEEKCSSSLLPRQFLCRLLQPTTIPSLEEILSKYEFLAVVVISFISVDANLYLNENETKWMFGLPCNFPPPFTLSSLISFFLFFLEKKLQGFGFRLERGRYCIVCLCWSCIDRWANI